MKKITWDAISVELTRKCQLSCKHCFKGEQQPLNIGNKYIDDWLKNTEIINRLHFTGGEPTLNLDAMQYIIDKLYEYRIPLFKLIIITNGYDVSDRFIDIVRQYKEFIGLCLSVEHPTYDPADSIQIAMSTDDYHVGYDKKQQFTLLKEKLSSIGVNAHNTLQGELCLARGRAVNLKESFNVDFRTTLPRAIELRTKDIRPICPHANSEAYKLLHDEQAIVVCDVILTAKGNIVRFPNMQFPYTIEDKKENIVLNVSDSKNYIEDILKYNVGKYNCADAKKLEDKENTGILAIADAMLEYARVKKIRPEFEDLAINNIINDLTDIDKETMIKADDISGIGKILLFSNVFTQNNNL